MAVIEIINGAFPAQKAQILFDQLTLKMPDGGQKTYGIKSSVASVETISESKKSVVFYLTLKDGSRCKAEADKKVAHNLTKYAGSSASITVSTLNPKQTKRQNIITGAITAFIMLLLVYKCSGDSPRSDPSVEEKKNEAAVYCKMLVQDRLKSPKSADFPWVIQATAGPNDTYSVVSYVDAQNSFGAMIRTNYLCRVKYNGGGVDGWIVEEFTLLNR